MDRPTGVFAGLATIDVAYAVPEFPARDRKVAATRQEATAGGPAANAAVTFAHFAGSAKLITAIGAHPLGALIRADLEAASVEALDAAAAITALPPVSSICVLEGSGERTVVSANAQAFSKLSYAFDPDWLTGASILLVDGHHLDLGVQAATAARERGIEVVLDGGSWKNGLERLLPRVDIAVCSADFRSPSDLRDYGVRDVVVTGGAGPIRWRSAAGDGEVEVRQVRPVDTLGAGDIFHGAFCWSRAQGGDLVDAIRFAAAVATESCLHWGTRSWREFVPCYDRRR